MKRLFLLMLFVLCASGIVLSQSAKSDLDAKMPVDKKITIGHLDNGMTYYIRANKKPENRVQFRLVTNAGSILEDESQRGLAHFCEHMAFNGIKGYPHNELISSLQKKGIEFGREINAYTSFDETVYYVNLPSDDTAMVEMGFKILDGWASGLLFDDQELEEERGVIHEEWRGSLGAGERLRDKTWPVMLKGSRYAERLPIGLESVIMGFKHDDIVRFYKDWYRPDLQAVIIVGDIDVQAVESRIKEVFGKYPKSVNPKERKVYGVPDNKEPLVAIATDKEATSTVLQIRWKHPNTYKGTVGDYREGLVRSLINMMLGDRFAELSDDPNAPMVYAGAGYGGFLGRGTDAFGAYASVKEGKSAEATELLFTEVRRAAQHGFLQTELDRQKESLLSSYTRAAKEADKTYNTSHADEYTRNFLTQEGIPGIRQEWRYAKEFVPEITLDEVNKMMAQWITDDNIIYYLTAPDNVAIVSEADALAMIEKFKTMQTEPWVDNFKDEPLMAEELPAVKATLTKTNEALDYKEYTLPNGIRFIIKKTDYKADEIQMLSYSWGGSSLYGDKEVYLVSNAAGVVDDAGLAQFNSTQLGKVLKGKIAGSSPVIRQLSQGFTGGCSPQDLETMMQLTYLYYLAPRKDQESLDKNIEQIRNSVRFAIEDPHTVFMKTFYETAYNNNPRLVVLPTEQQISSLQLDDIHRVYRERFHDASGQTFFFVGNIKDEDIDIIAKYLGNLPCDGSQKNEGFKDVSPKFVDGVVHKTVSKGTDKQGKLLIYGETGNFAPTPENILTVSQLSDAVEITALEVIREKMGGTYSPSVSISCSILPKGEFSWMFYIECDPDKAAEIEKVVFDIVKQYKKKGPDAVTLAKVQEQQVSNRETAMQSNGYWMGQIVASYQYNQNRDGEASLADFAARVKKITAKDIKKIAKAFINEKNYVSITLVPEEQ